jgi:hypothetical protein
MTAPTLICTSARTTVAETLQLYAALMTGNARRLTAVIITMIAVSLPVTHRNLHCVALDVRYPPN